MTLDPEAVQRNAFLQVLHGQVVVLLHRGHTDIRQQVHERDIVPFHSQREKKKWDEREKYKKGEGEERKRKQTEGRDSSVGRPSD